jgi:putative transposase
MDQQSGRKSCTDTRRPTLQQARRLERMLLLCRHIDNAVCGEWREVWRLRGVILRDDQRQPEKPGLKEAMPESGEVNAVRSQVVQDGVLRVARADQACFRRVQAGETAGSPRFQGRTREQRHTSLQGGGHGCARLECGLLVWRTIGRVVVRWSRPLVGTR